MKFDESVKYAKSHEWVRKESGTVIIGISDYAQDSLGDVVFVELPETGDTFEQGSTFGVVESVKAASDVYMPVGGEIVEVNETLGDTPDKVNEDPFGDGWLVKVVPSNPKDLDSLMSAAEYKTYTEGLDD